MKLRSLTAKSRNDLARVLGRTNVDQPPSAIFFDPESEIATAGLRTTLGAVPVGFAVCYRGRTSFPPPESPRVLDWLKHTFAVDEPGEAAPDPELAPTVEKLCREVVRRRLTTPALILLESSRPLNYVGSQVLHFFGPMISAITDARGHEHLARFLEHRGSIDYLCRRIEELESHATQRTATGGELNHRDTEGTEKR